MTTVTQPPQETTMTKKIALALLTTTGLAFIALMLNSKKS